MVKNGENDFSGVPPLASPCTISILETIPTSERLQEFCAHFQSEKLLHPTFNRIYEARTLYMAYPTSSTTGKDYYGGAVPIESPVATPKGNAGSPDAGYGTAHGQPELIGVNDGHHHNSGERTVAAIDRQSTGWFAFFRTKNFYIALIIGYAV